MTENNLDTERVYKELGSPPTLSSLIDNPPKLAVQLDLQVRLFSASAKKSNCRLYVFDRVFILAIKREQEDVEVVWYADEHKKKVEDNLNSDEKEIEEIKQLEERHEEESEFTLQFFMDLSQTYPSLYTAPNSQQSTIFFTRIANVDFTSKIKEMKNLINSTIVVNVCQIYFEEKDFEQVKMMIGIMSENISAMFRTDRHAGFQRGSIDQNEKKSRVMSKSSRRKTGRTLTRDKKKSVRGSKIKQNMQEMRKKQQRVQKTNGSESGEFGVVFCQKNKGFEISDGRDEEAGVFIQSVEADSLAEAAGLSIGDRLLFIDTERINDKTDFEMLKEKVEAKTCEKEKTLFIFSRTMDEDMKLRVHSKMSSRGSSGEAKDNDFSLMIEKENLINKLKESTPSASSLIGLPPSDLKEIIVLRKRKKKKKKMFDEEPKLEPDVFEVVETEIRRKKVEMKAKVWDKMRRGFKVDLSKLEEKKKKQEFEDDANYEDENTQKLFESLIYSLTSKKEKTCIYNLQEIYNTEKKYLEELNMLLNAKLELLKMKKNEKCKNIQGRIFCEHFKPHRLCSLESKLKVDAIEEKDLDSVFLNIKSLINIHDNIVKGLRRQMSDLIDTERSKYGIVELLQIYCSVYTTYCPFFTMYVQYIQRYNLAVTTQKTLKAENQFFAAGLTMIERTYKITFMSLINKPLGRITKYPLFFATLSGYVRKYINDELHSGLKEKKKDANAKIKKFHKMIKDLETAEKGVTQVVEKVNVKVGEAENLQKMVKAYDEIGGPKKIPDLLQGWRRYKDQMQIMKFEMGSELDDEYDDPHIYIFNDIIVIATPPVVLNRRLSIASITSTNAGEAISAAAKAASNLFSSTIRKGSKLNFSSRQSNKIDEAFLKTLSNRRERNYKSRRGSNSIARQTKLNANSSHNSKRNKTQGNGMEEEKVDLNPVATLKVNRLVRADFIQDFDMEDEPVFIIQYHYETNVGLASFHVDQVRFCFDSKEEREQFASTISELKDEYKQRRKGFEKAKEKIQKSNMQKSNSFKKGKK